QFELVEKRRRVPDLSAADPRFRPLLERMLQPNPNDRPGSMTEIENWNFVRPAAIRTSTPIKEDTVTEIPAILRPRPARRRSMPGAAAAILFAFSIAGSLYFWKSREGETPSHADIHVTPSLTPTLVPSPARTPVAPSSAPTLVPSPAATPVAPSS